MKTQIRYMACLLIGAAVLMGCSDEEVSPTNNDEITETDTKYVGQAVGNFSADEWYPGGALGTTGNTAAGCYEDESPATTQSSMSDDFNDGASFFEHKYTLSTAPYKGLGPIYSRRSCIYCHPSYGHGKRQLQYQGDIMGNGYLLALFYPAGSADANGKSYAEDTYVSEVTGVPQTMAVAPFMPEINESGIHMQWLTATDEHGNKFPDGETYELIYPEVNIDMDAINTSPKPAAGFTVRVESTIGFQGAALLDAIPEDSIKKQYASEARFATLNPKMWDAATGDWATTAWQDLSHGKKGIKKFNYQCSRASLQQDYAIWEICGVTRKDLHYLYTTKAWAKANAENEEVISYIMKNGADKNSLLNPYYGDGSRDSVSYLVNLLLGLNSADDAPTYENYFVSRYGEEMADKSYYQFMVWQRGLAIPRARNLNDKTVQRGKELFMEIGCANCHRPSWTTGDDNYWASDFVNGMGKLPTYPHQKIYPYTDMVQHRLYMVNDIIFGWCRTTPLWGRGLSLANTGAEDRLHDCRARNEIEAIMWHGYSNKSDAYSATQNFYNLSKDDRDAVVKFLRSI